MIKKRLPKINIVYNLSTTNNWSIENDMSDVDPFMTKVQKILLNKGFRWLGGKTEVFDHNTITYTTEFLAISSEYCDDNNEFGYWSDGNFSSSYFDGDYELVLKASEILNNKNRIC